MNTRRNSNLLEGLESRLMYITTSFDGTTGDDVITLTVTGNDIVCNINGDVTTRNSLLFNEIEINGLQGNDTININRTEVDAVVVNAGTGDDNIRLAPGSHDMFNLFAEV